MRPSLRSRRRRAPRDSARSSARPRPLAATGGARDDAQHACTGDDRVRHPPLVDFVSAPEDQLFEGPLLISHLFGIDTRVGLVDVSWTDLDVDREQGRRALPTIGGRWVAGSLVCVQISRELMQELIDHARREAPNECCGVVSTRHGVALRVHRAVNIHASPLRYEIGPEELLRIYREIDDAGCELGAIYHSHTRSDPFPSQTDVNLAAGWPEPLYLIIGIAGETPELPAYTIRDGQVEPAELEVV